MKLNQFLTAVSILSVTVQVNYATLITISDLSLEAQDSLVAHFDGRTGVATTGVNVDSWTPVDLDGTALPGQIISSTARPSGGAADLITYDAASSSLTFTDPTSGALGRYLTGTLNTSGSGLSYTIIWLGHYSSGDTNGFENEGIYAYDIGSEMSHQRDDDDGIFRAEFHDGSSTFAADDITAFDDIDTVWSTVYTPSSHTAYANGTNLNAQGTPSYSVAENPTIVMGAFSEGGYDMLGSISQFVIFEGVLSDADRGLVENYLAAIPEPSLVSVFCGLTAMFLIVFRRR